MLQLQQLHISTAEREIIRGIDLDIHAATTTVILGPNGSGKTSLALALVGHPRYMLQGKILFEGQDITHTSATERAEMGIFLSFQNIPEIPGVVLVEYLHTIYSAHFRHHHPTQKPPSYFVFRRMVEKLMREYLLPTEFLERELGIGFSGGEKRRLELLQIALLDPQVIILDEVDSGLDIDTIDILRHNFDTWRRSKKYVIVISHNLNLLKSIAIDEVLVLEDGRFTERGTSTLIDTISTRGFRG